MPLLRKNRRWIWILAGFLIFLSTLYFVLTKQPGPEPTYQGKTVTQWIREIPDKQTNSLLNIYELTGAPEDAVPTITVLNALGPKALPAIQRHIRPTGSLGFELANTWNQHFSPPDANPTRLRVPRLVMKLFAQPPPLDPAMQGKAVFALIHLDHELRRKSLPWALSIFKRKEPLGHYTPNVLLLGLGTNNAPGLSRYISMLEKFEKQPNPDFWMSLVFDQIEACGPHAKRILPRVEQFLFSRNHEIRIATGRVIASIDPLQRKRIAQKLLPEVLKNIETNRVGTIHMDARFLGTLKEEGRSALPVIVSRLRRYFSDPLMPLATRPFEYVNSLELLRSAVKIEPTHPEVLELLKKALAHEHLWVVGVEIFSEAGPVAKPLIPPFLEVSLRLQSGLNFWSMQAKNLLKVDPDLSLTVPSIVLKYRDPNQAVRENCEDLMRLLGPPAIPVLEKVSKAHSDSMVRSSAELMLRKIRAKTL